MSRPAPPRDEGLPLLLEAAAPSAISPWERAAGIPSRLVGSRGIVAGLVSIAVLAGATRAALDVNGSYLWMLGAGLVLVGFVASIEHPSVRPVAFGLGVWALALRLAALLGCSILAAATGGVVLGPDSSWYYDASVDLASRGLHLPLLPVVYYGTYHVGHVYLFAACVRYLHADLFGLQALNCALGAAAAPLAFGIARKAAPGAALGIAGVVAIYPSLVAFGALDLLKDPSILCAYLALLWALLHLMDTGTLARAGLLTGVGSIAALYVRTSRFYMFTYMEVALAAVLTAGVLLRRRPFRRVSGLAGAVSIFAAGEALPLAGMWPLSPLLLLVMAAHTLNIPIGGGPGFLDQIRAVRSLTEGAQVAAHGVWKLPVGIVHRLLGPFPWMLPHGWTFPALQQAEFYLYPAVLTWYALLPLVVLGFAATARPSVARSERGFSVLLVSVFSLLCGAQYLFIDSSYRQREILIPVLLMIAWFGLLFVRDRRIDWRWYRWYWCGLGAFAAVHLIVKAAFHV